ncbi:MAG TPA: hypothetical protein VFN41_09840 [Candidatus Limnocylindrales bacterium]|nr:hypothetical protein [Candidatus Limnocylindrales bacterium]
MTGPAWKEGERPRTIIAPKLEAVSSEALDLPSLRVVADERTDSLDDPARTAVRAGPDRCICPVKTLELVGLALAKQLHSDDTDRRERTTQFLLVGGDLVQHPLRHFCRRLGTVDIGWDDRGWSGELLQLLAAGHEQRGQRDADDAVVQHGTDMLDEGTAALGPVVDRAVSDQS